LEDDKKSTYYWIEVINRSSVELPNNVKILCEYFDIHPLTIEDIGTLVPYMKLDLFHHQAALFILMKIITWNGQRVQQQQISFYLKCSQNLLITFQEKSSDDKKQSLFQTIRKRLRRQSENNDVHRRLRQLNVDYLLYCLRDDIIDRYSLYLHRRIK
jgi:magnesium transporter